MTRPPPNRRAFIAGAGALFVSGCTILKTPVVPQLYVLRPMLAPTMGAPVRWRLAIASPEAAQSLDTPRIALTRSATTMDYFANAAWTDPVPLMVQRLLLQSFETGGRIVAVDRDTAGLETDYLLETEIRDFTAHYDTPEGAPQIVVNIQARMVKMPQRDIAGGLNAQQQAQASGNNLDSIVGAFNQACGAALAQITVWALSMSPPSPA
jgi:cholesterol transport system auxiliary component